MMLRFRLLSLFALSVALPALAVAQQPTVQPPIPEQAAPDGVRHTVSFTGLDDHAALKTLLQDVSALERLKGDPPPSLAGLRARAEQDRDGLLAALRSEAYFAATITVAIGAAGTDGTVPVTLQVAPGPRYMIEQVVLEPMAESPADPATALANSPLGLAPGAPARGPDIQTSIDRLPARLANLGYPTARTGVADMIVDHGSRGVRLRVPVNTGPKASLGAVQISGLQTLDASLVSNRIPWQPGDVYDPAKLDRFRQQLGKLDVFQTTRATPAKQLAADNSMQVDLAVTEKPPRFIGGGVSYGLSEGLDTNFYWGHRNLFGGAERLRLDADVGRVGAVDGQGQDASLSLSFAKPDVLAPLQTFKTSITAEQEQPEAYQQRALSVAAGFEREISPILTIGYGTTLEFANTDDPSDSDRQTLSWGFPLNLSRSTTDSPLEPTQGSKFTAEVTPYIATLDKTIGYVRTQLGTSWYWKIGEGARPQILATRAAYGMLFGANASDVVADKRFYAGGAGSVRGYGTQLIGPLDSDGTPRGGRNLITAAAEMRLHLSEDWGVVPFVDVGSVTRSVAPDMAEDVQVGAGLGLVYYTPIGPVRADLAVPVNPRATDDQFQFYISLGQPF